MRPIMQHKADWKSLDANPFRTINIYPALTQRFPALPQAIAPYPNRLARNPPLLSVPGCQPPGRRFAFAVNTACRAEWA